MTSVNFYSIHYTNRASNITKIEKMMMKYLEQYYEHIILGDTELQNFKDIIKLKTESLCNAHQNCKKPEISIQDKLSEDTIFVYVGSVLINISKLKTHAVILTLNFTAPFQIELSRLKSEVNEGNA